MPYFLAVDAGGTKTEFALADEHRELVRIRTGSIQRLRVTSEVARTHLRGALDEIEATTGISMRSITRCCIGTSGETVPLVVDWVREAFGDWVGGELLLLSDVEIALDACFQGNRGVLVLAGTGSNIAGRAARGRIITAGGWGPVMADQGSGQFLGIEGLRRSFLALDRQGQENELPLPRLLQQAMQHWSLDSLGALIEHANGNPGPNFSTLAPLVVQNAAEGDELACQILEQGGRDLAMLTGLLIERMQRMEDAAGFTPPAVAVAGSILARVPRVRNALTKSLQATYPDIQLMDAPADPVSGALWRARRGH